MAQMGTGIIATLVSIPTMYMTFRRIITFISFVVASFIWKLELYLPNSDFYTVSAHSALDVLTQTGRLYRQEMLKNFPQSTRAPWTVRLMAYISSMSYVHAVQMHSC